MPTNQTAKASAIAQDRLAAKTLNVDALTDQAVEALAEGREFKSVIDTLSQSLASIDESSLLSGVTSLKVKIQARVDEPVFRILCQPRDRSDPNAQVVLAHATNKMLAQSFHRYLTAGPAVHDLLAILSDLPIYRVPSKEGLAERMAENHPESPNGAPEKPKTRRSVFSTR